MDLRKVKTLIDLVAESSITELEITEGEGKVRIVKAGVAPPASAIASLSSPSAASGTVSVAAAPSAVVVPSTPLAEATGHVVKSPMVGTYYSASAPGKPPFVEVGSKVSASDTVCIIEAMKLLNEIEAGFDGEIKKILVQNGQPVEYGQALFIIE